jgi:hypothetical protein
MRTGRRAAVAGGDARRQRGLVAEGGRRGRAGEEEPGRCADRIGALPLDPEKAAGRRSGATWGAGLGFLGVWGGDMGGEGAGWAGLGGGPVGPRPSRPVGVSFQFFFV